MGVRCICDDDDDVVVVVVEPLVLYVINVSMDNEETLVYVS